MKKEKVDVCFERITSEDMPESLKASDMHNVRGGSEIVMKRGTKGGAFGASACACACIIELDH